MKTYLQSIEMAAEKTSDCQVEIAIADNSKEKQTVNTDEYKKLLVKQYVFDNVGYLGGALGVINSIKTEEYDFVAISNVDLKMDESFLHVLKDVKKDNHIAWIAPRIYSKEEDRDINPKVIERYSKRKLRLLYYMYKFPIFFYLYTATVYKRKKLAPKYDEMNIYAGHGSFMLLTRQFFKDYKKIDYPVFLFGEELFLAELIRNKGLTVRYMPSLRIEDSEHVSTSKMKKGFYFKCNTESMKYILDTFYE